jgi:hypothetical protein
MRLTLVLASLGAATWSCGDDDAFTGSASTTASTGGGGGTGGHETTSTPTSAASGTASGGTGSGGAAIGTNRVFVTSTKHDGNFGGLAGADSECQARADSAGLGGLWLAWLGDGDVGPVDRFVHSDKPYNLVGGSVIANQWEDLIDGTILIPLNRDETGTLLPSDDDMIVYTAVFHTGGNPTPVNCMKWSDASESLVPTGLATAVDTGWTVTAPHFCSEMHRIYCFEQ